ncbi:MAG: MFS transporter [Candidatus Nanopelagicales bacterium]
MTATPSIDAATVAATQRRTLVVLSMVQVLNGLGVSAGIAVGALLAVGIAGSDWVAGLAQTAMVLGAALAALPLASLMNRAGRRVGLVAGLATGAAGAAIVLLAASWRSLPVLLVGLLLAGVATASGLQARYAATDLAAPDRIARSLSIVLWATTVGAVVGPNIAEPAGSVALSLGMPQLSGAFLFALVVFGMAVVVAWVGLRPDPLLLARRYAGVAPGSVVHGRARDALREVRRRPRALLGLVAVAVAHTAMVSVMVMTPIHMRHVDASLTVIGLVISVHVLGMYAFSPIVGWAADRVGRVRVIAVGAGLLALSAVIAGMAAPEDSVVLGIGLFLLGLGWSCGLVAGSALLSESVPADIRTTVQGASDLVMNVCGAAGGALAGVVVALFSYGWLNVLTGALVIGLGVATTHPACRTGSNTRSS